MESDIPTKKEKHNSDNNYLLNSLLIFKDTGQFIIQQTKNIFEKYNVPQKTESAVRYLAKRPLIAVLLLIITGISIIPVTLFILFIIGTFFLTFTGFIVIEGTILTVGAAILCSCLLTIWIILIVVGGTIVVTYLGLIRMHGILNGKTNETSQQTIDNTSLHDGKSD